VSSYFGEKSSQKCHPPVQAVNWPGSIHSISRVDAWVEQYPTRQVFSCRRFITSFTISSSSSAASRVAPIYPILVAVGSDCAWPISRSSKRAASAIESSTPCSAWERPHPRKTSDAL